jgi:serine/threonine protein kinase
MIFSKELYKPFKKQYPSHIFLQDKREQILNELGTLSEASCYPGLVEFHGAFYKPNSGAIYFALEYMEVGSLADIIRVKKFIPEPVLAHMLMKVLPVSIFYFQMLMFHLFTENSYELVIWYVL